MGDDAAANQRCRICGREAVIESGFCRIYQSGIRLALCSPECVEDFLRNRDHHTEAAVQLDLLDELIEEKRWTSVQE